MIGTVIFILSVLLLLGVAFTVYCIKMAEVDEGEMEERPDEFSFSKPVGWKVGKLPKEFQNAKKVELKETYANKKSNSLDDLSEKFSAYETKPSDLL